MVQWNLGPTWAERTRSYARDATKPIVGRLTRQTPLAFQISTATRERIWLPKKLVRHDAEKGIFMVPTWLANEKLLD